MKRVILSIVALTAMSLACEVHHTPEPVCTECVNGTNGKDGLSIKGKDGINGKDGKDGINGKDGLSIKGKDGINGKDGLSIKGKDGVVDYSKINEFISYQYEYLSDMSTDSEVFISKISTDMETLFSEYEKSMDRYESFLVDSSAGAIAIGSIDFGSTCAGMWEVGVGIGTSAGLDDQGYAGAVGAKYGLTDNTAIIVKGWGADSDSYAMGAGATWRF